MKDLRIRNWVVLICLFIPVSAAAQSETVIVRDNSLSGLWRISMPAGFGTNGVTSKFQPMRDVYCRINQDQIHCLNGGFSRSGTVTLDGQSVHIAWGTMMLRVVIDGTYANASIDGTFAFKLAGVSHEAPEKSHSTRLPPLSVTEDGGGKASLIRQIIEQAAAGAVTVPHDDKAITQNGGALPKEIGPLGAIEAIAWLGHSPRLGNPDSGDFFSVYAVEFTNGELVCGLHQRPDGILDAFVCV